jgi:endonuclease/exonuclease/phosphatase family metal-dependent hydrolase
MTSSTYLSRSNRKKMEFKIINWNVAGAKFLEQKAKERAITRTKINETLISLIKEHDPDVVTLQEIVQYKDPNGKIVDLIDPPGDYKYYSFPLIDTDRLSFKGKWDKVRRLGGWSPETFFAQGNAILYHKNVAHVPVWSLLSNGKFAKRDNRHYVEQVNIESGLYFGDRNTEPRSALVSHFIFNPDNDSKPQDVFVVNMHLTTLMMEREGIPEIDQRATKIRLSQLDIVFNGIVSRYNTWKREGFLDRGKKLNLSKEETIERHEPLWVLVGDFNFTPESEEYLTIKHLNFVDVILPEKKAPGTKAKGVGKPATIVVDYVFAGPKFISLDPNITQFDLLENCVDHDIKCSDHYPCVATITIRREYRPRHN